MAVGTATVSRKLPPRSCNFGYGDGAIIPPARDEGSRADEHTHVLFHFNGMTEGELLVHRRETQGQDRELKAR